MTSKPSPQSENDRPETSPNAQALSQREIRNLFLLDSLQTKTILLPFAVFAIGLIYNILYAPILGTSILVLIVTFTAGVFGAACFVWRSVIHYQQGYTQKLLELTAYYETENSLRIEASLHERFAILEQGINEINAQEGLKTLHRLEHDYRQLRQVLRRGEEADYLATSNLALLVRETVLQGLNVLEHALELECAIGSVDGNQLQEEIEESRTKGGFTQAKSY